MARIPSVTVSDEFMALIEAYSKSKNCSIGKAVRELLEKSSELRIFALDNNMSMDSGVREWGGRRIPKDVQALLDRANKEIK